MVNVAEGFEKKWDDYFAQQEKIRVRNLFGKSGGEDEEKIKKDTVPLTDHFDVKKGTSAGASLEAINRILGPHERFRLAMEEMEMLFQDVDLHGERRRQAARVKAVALEEARSAASKGGDTFHLSVDKNKFKNSNHHMQKAKKKWWQLTDKDGNLQVEGVDGKMEAVSGSALERKEGRAGEKGGCKPYVQTKQNHRAFHRVLVLTRQNKSQFRNLRQQTHELKRVVLSELMRRAHDQQRLWFNKWQQQEHLLKAALEQYVKKVKEKQTAELGGGEGSNLDANRKNDASANYKSREEASTQRRNTRAKRRETRLRRQMEVDVDKEEGEGEGEKEELGKQGGGRGPSIEKLGGGKSKAVKGDVFGQLQESLKTSPLLLSSYHEPQFFHRLLKYNQERAFSRSKWVKWQAKIDHLKDLERRRDELEAEAAKLEFTYVCPVAFKHAGSAHCKRCDRRFFKNQAMWLTNVNEPLTKIESMMNLDHCLIYCKDKLRENAAARLKLENEIYALELELFGESAGYLQRKYSLHRSYVRCKGREEKVEESLEEYREKRFEEMARHVRDGRNDTGALYIKYADIEDKLEAYLNYHAQLRRRRLRVAGKRIIRIWRERKKTRELKAIEDEKERTRQLREHLHMVAAEEEAVRRAAEKKSIEEMKEAAKKRLEKFEKANTFVCERKECCGRVFNSRDLFELHEKLHFNEDLKKNAILKKKKEQGEARLKREKIFMEQLRKKRSERRAAELPTLSSVSAFSSSTPEAKDTELDSLLDSNFASESNISEVEEFFRVTSPTSFTRHMQHMQERPTSPSVPKLFLDFKSLGGVHGDRDLAAQWGTTGEEKELGRGSTGPETVMTENKEGPGQEQQHQQPQSRQQQQQNQPQQHFFDDVSLTSSITDDFDFLSEGELLSSRSLLLSGRSAVTGIDLSEAIQEIMPRREVHDNFASPSFVLVSTHVMLSQDLPQEIFLNKSLMRIGRSDKCDIQIQPMINLHMIAKVSAGWRQD